MTFKTRPAPYLGDMISMDGAFLGLYTFTGDRGWLIRATACAGFIVKNFAAKTGDGYDTMKTATDRVYDPTSEPGGQFRRSLGDQSSCSRES
jgi:uncharacterized protein YyaL (SSP411 family)